MGQSVGFIPLLAKRVFVANALTERFVFEFNILVRRIIVENGLV